jgi:hypothetical protein
MITQTTQGYNGIRLPKDKARILKVGRATHHMQGIINKITFQAGFPPETL